MLQRVLVVVCAVAVLGSSACGAGQTTSGEASSGKEVADADPWTGVWECGEMILHMTSSGGGRYTGSFYDGDGEALSGFPPIAMAEVEGSLVGEVTLPDGDRVRVTYALAADGGTLAETVDTLDASAQTVVDTMSERGWSLADADTPAELILAREAQALAHKDQVFQERLREIQGGIEAYRDQYGEYPAEDLVSRNGYVGSSFVASWPDDPYAELGDPSDQLGHRQPMVPGTEPGQFTYTVSEDGAVYELRGYTQDGSVVSP